MLLPHPDPPRPDTADAPSVSPTAVKRRYPLLATVAVPLVLCAVLLLARSFAAGDRVRSGHAVPNPFFTQRTELAGSVVAERTLPSGVALYRMDFSDGATQEAMADAVHLVHIPAGVGPVPLDRVVLDSNGGPRPYYGYLYTSADAATERSQQAAARFADRFPGTFFVSEAAVAAHGGDLEGFAKANGIRFRLASATSTGADTVLLRGPGLVAVIPVDEHLRLSLAPTCGDGLVSGDEGCDDGNADGGDGCSRTCLVEDGYSCAPTNPSRCAVAPVCGNGRVETSEQCDDGNRDPRDGCSPGCVVETGFTCDGSEPSRCAPLGACGDGTKDEGEGCDDGNADGGDGCDSACAPEPGFACDDASPGSCRPAAVCGNGVREGDEDCDDGNLSVGDGCDPACLAEPVPECEGSEAAFQLTTLISVPGGGWRRVGPQLSPRDGEEPAAVTPLGGGRVRLGEGTGYEIVRSVEPGTESLRVRDTFSNSGAEDLGFMVEYRLPLPDDVATVHVGGDPDPRKSTAAAPSPRNPTLYARINERLALGLAVQDDALRNQGLFRYRSKDDGGDGALGVRTERLVVPAGKSITLEFALYLLPGGDYWDFVNRVRADWGVTVTLDGPYWWLYPSTLPVVPRDWFRQKTAGWLASHRIKAIVGPSWLLPEFEGQRWFTPSALGPAIWDEYFAPFRRQLHDAFSALREVASSLPEGSPGKDVELLVYNHAFFRSPPDPGDHVSPSAVTFADGSLYRDNWGKAYATGAGLVPRLTADAWGDYGRQTADAFRRQFTDPEMAVPGMGMYLDESDGPGRLVDKVTYAAWDGFSGILDPATFAVRQRIGYIAVLSQEFRRHVLEEFGVPTLANDQPHLLRENQGRALRFTEMWGNPSNAYYSHLYSPLAFVHGIEAVSMQDVRDLLEMGMILCITAPEARTAAAVERFFPITVTELHSGWVAGRERVITAVSGDFGWDDDHEARLWLFGADGKPAGHEPPWHPQLGKTRIDVPEGGVAVLERRDRAR